MNGKEKPKKMNAKKGEKSISITTSLLWNTTIYRVFTLQYNNLLCLYSAIQQCNGREWTVKKPKKTNEKKIER